MQPHAPATLWTRQYRWHAIGTPGFELLEIGERKGGIDARGMIISEAEGVAFGASYHIRLGHDWTFEALNLQLLDGRRLKLRSDGHGNWTENDGTPRPDLADCVDIDFSGSPFTNTLPIRRSRLKTGLPVPFTMAYVDLFALTVVTDDQIYTRLDDTHFRYQSADGTFERVLTIDADSIVISYPGHFERLEN
jgi:hypothetical protein